jgi:DNA helicase-2/ATP-dependent DNA helicase PcrA
VAPDAEAGEMRRHGADLVLGSLDKLRRGEALGTVLAPVEVPGDGDGAEAADGADGAEAADSADGADAVTAGAVTAGAGADGTAPATEPAKDRGEASDAAADLPIPSPRDGAAAPAVPPTPAAPPVPELPPGLAAAEAEDLAEIASWDRDLEALLTELRRSRDIARYAPLPPSMSASQLMRYRQDPSGFRRGLARPMPQPPAPSARLGTRFHAWIEQLFGQQALFDYDDLPGAADEEIADEADLRVLQDAFLRTPWADSLPEAIEQPFQVMLGGRVIRGRIDAVYRTAGGYEVVDWKTSRQHNADPVQLAVYRLAWAEMRGLPVDSVTAAFVYVRDGSTIRPGDLPGREELDHLFGTV